MASSSEKKLPACAIRGVAICHPGQCPRGPVPNVGQSAGELCASYRMYKVEYNMILVRRRLTPDLCQMRLRHSTTALCGYSHWTVLVAARCQTAGATRPASSRSN